MNAEPPFCSGPARWLARWLFVAMLGWLVALVPPASLAREPAPGGLASADVAVLDLPREAREVLAAVRAGGPFRYPKDGSVFGNRERLLPSMPRGWYTEYTVRTPGERDRGARRLVVGGPPRTSDEIWYTDDHYASFRRVRE